jgi:hypothetical protein
MTDQQANRVATVLIGVAAAGAAYVVFRNPPLRRAVWQVVRTTLAPTVAAWLMTEARTAWNRGPDDGRAAAQAAAPFAPAARDMMSP